MKRLWGLILCGWAVGCATSPPEPRIYQLGGFSGSDRLLSNRFVARPVGTIFLDGQSRELLVLIDMQGRRQYLVSSGLEITPLAPIHELQESPSVLK